MSYPPSLALLRRLARTAALAAVTVACAAGFGLCRAQGRVDTVSPGPGALTQARSHADFALKGRSLYAQPGSFVDENGHALPLSVLAGKPAIVAMEYTDCRFVCSINWQTLMAIQNRADARGLELQFLVISLDPEQDTPQLWQAYRKVRGLPPRANWHFLTADRATTNRIAAWLGVRWWYYESHIMHDLRILHYGADGKLIHAMEHLDVPLDDFLNS